jgi:hypothetical protein
MRTLALASALLALAASARAEEPTAQEIQERIRYSHTLKDVELDGRLDGDGGRSPVPFLLRIQGGDIGFHFSDPRQSLELRQDGDKLTLVEDSGGGPAAVPEAKLSEPVRGTDVLHEDLAMRFLYWPWVNKVGEETLKNRTAWKLHIQNTGGGGPYSQVFVWADAKSAALMKLEAFDWKGHLVKRYEVVSGQKVDDAWLPKKMNITSYDPDSPDPRRPKQVGRTALELREPQR